jgi:membrane-associated PAP2 superfamily phosphatase
MTRAKHVVLTIVTLTACLLWFESIPADIWLQDALYDENAQHWLWSSANPLARFVFYDGPKGLLLLFALCLAFALAFIRRLPVLAPYRSGMRIVLLSLILVPASIAGLKQINGVGCPRDLALFGGQAAYVGIAESFFADRPQPLAQRPCFPAAHASGGFALLSLFFLFKERRNRARAAYLALAAGWAMGGYKMLIGDHFLSHTIVSMLLAWLIINAVVIAEQGVGASTVARP